MSVEWCMLAAVKQDFFDPAQNTKRQAHFMQDCCIRVAATVVLPRRKSLGSVLRGKCTILPRLRIFSPTSYIFGNKGLNQ